MVYFVSLSWTLLILFPDIRPVKPLSRRALNPGCHNLCSNSHIRGDACLLSKTAKKRANGVAVFGGCPIRYNRAPFIQ